jgi:hypothetical protein
LRLILLLTLAAMCVVSQAADTAFTPLLAYQGTWSVTRANAAPGSKPEELVNHCAVLGQYFACQQTVNGQAGNLVVFIATTKPGHYYTQNITSEGRATGRADLQVAGDQWTYTNTWDQGGKTTYYRTTNSWGGKNKIHFEQAESDDGKDYKITGSGDEVKVAAGRK